ncbi:hypothetical protein ACEQ8H_008858 [Pleosporales sp. CAS-2024a]
MTSSAAALPRAPTSNQQYDVDVDLTVIHLTTPMTLPAHHKIVVTCLSDIKLSLVSSAPHQQQHTYLAARHPTTILTTAPTLLAPSARLGPAFARAWRRLPPELRLRVLAFSMRCTSTTRPWLHPRSRADRAPLRAHLAMGPDIAPWAAHAYYTANRFLVRNAWDREWDLDLDWPGVGVRALVRRVALCVWTRAGDWMAARRGIEQAHAGLREMHSVLVVVHWHVSAVGEFLQTCLTSGSSGRIRMACRGWVEFAGHQDPEETWILERVLRPKGLNMEDLKKRIRDEFVFKGD